VIRKCSTHSLSICKSLNGLLLSCTAKTVDWLHLFSSGKKSLEALSLTQTALYQHICRTVMQATIWSQTTSVHMDIPDFQEWGWHKESSGRCLPYWTALEDSSKACSILLQCGCMKSCTRNCKCSSAGVRCIVLCKCEGMKMHERLLICLLTTYSVCIVLILMIVYVWKKIYMFQSSF
jgi:hypothetical protein